MSVFARSPSRIDGSSNQPLNSLYSISETGTESDLYSVDSISSCFSHKSNTSISSVESDDSYDSNTTPSSLHRQENTRRAHREQQRPRPLPVRPLPLPLPRSHLRPRSPQRRKVRRLPVPPLPIALFPTVSPTACTTPIVDSRDEPQFERFAWDGLLDWDKIDEIIYSLP